MMAKEFKQLPRDRLTYAMMLGLPVIQLLLFGYAINTEPRHLPTAVLVQEEPVFARSILSALGNTGYFDLSPRPRSPAEAGRDDPQSGEVQFAVTIPADFTRRVARGDRAQILVEADATDPSATGGAVAALAALPRQALAHDLKGALAGQAATRPPFEVVRPPPLQSRGHHRLQHRAGPAGRDPVPDPGDDDRAQRHPRDRARHHGDACWRRRCEPLEVMVGKLAPYVMVGLVQTVIILIWRRLLFDVPMEGGWIGLSPRRRPVHRRPAGAGLPDLDRWRARSCRPCR